MRNTYANVYIYRRNSISRGNGCARIHARGNPPHLPRETDRRIRYPSNNYNRSRVFTYIYIVYVRFRDLLLSSPPHRHQPQDGKIIGGPPHCS